MTPKRKRNLKQASKYRGKPCVVCDTRTNTVGDHIKTFGSGGECVDDNMWSLCVRHHSLKGDQGLTTFVRKYPHLKKILKEKGWEFEEFTQKWIRLTPDGWETDET